eukprot:1094423-Pleurochrysis_carterae.AAC.2
MMHNTSLSQRMPSHFASTALHAEYFMVSVLSLLDPWFLPVSATLLELIDHPSDVALSRSLKGYLSVGLKAVSLGRERIHEVPGSLNEKGGRVSAKTSQTFFSIGKPLTPRGLAYVVHDDSGVRDRAASWRWRRDVKRGLLVCLQKLLCSAPWRVLRGVVICPP